MRSAGLADHVHELPSFRRLVRRLRDSLQEGRSVVVVLPEPRDEDDLWLGLGEELHLRQMATERLDLEQVGAEGDPLETVAGFLSPDREARTTRVQDLLRSRGLPDVLSLRGIDALPDRAQRRWLDLVTSWSQASQVLSGEAPRCALLVALRSSRLRVSVPRADVRLRVEYWLGSPSTEELQHLARQGGDPPPHRHWRETMVLAYAGEDAALAERLLSTPLDQPDWPTPELERYARDRGWATAPRPDEVRRIVEALPPRPTPGPTLHEVPPAAWDPWSRGLLNWNPWCGWELHAAWLALHGPRHLLQHRLWRAQVALVLPLVDRLRLAVCAWLDERYDADWPLRWAQPPDPQELEAVTADPYACQWGHLVEILRAPEFRGEEALRRTARVARNVRNQLSHQKCVPWGDFVELWRGV